MTTAVEKLSLNNWDAMAAQLAKSIENSILYWDYEEFPFRTIIDLYREAETYPDIKLRKMLKTKLKLSVAESIKFAMNIRSENFEVPQVVLRHCEKKILEKYKEMEQELYEEINSVDDFHEDVAFIRYSQLSRRCEELEALYQAFDLVFENPEPENYELEEMLEWE